MMIAKKTVSICTIALFILMCCISSIYAYNYNDSNDDTVIEDNDNSRGNDYQDEKGYQEEEQYDDETEEYEEPQNESDNYDIDQYDDDDDEEEK